MPRQPHTPKLCHHKATGQAYVTLAGKERYLGNHGTPEALAAYKKIMAEWFANGPAVAAAAVKGGDYTIAELCAAFWEHAQKYYRHPDCTPTGEIEPFKQAIRKLRKLYGGIAAVEFGPLSMKAVRQSMIEAGWTRKNINRHVGRIRQVFRWGVENEKVSATIVTALEAVSPLMPGRSDAEESAPIKPADEAHIAAVEKFVSGQVWGMIQTQLLTGMRPNEICRMRMKDIDRGKDGKAAVWKYAPPKHKTAHHGIARVILIGPAAQRVLTPFLKFDGEAFMFSPAEAEAARNEARRAARETPLTPSQLARAPKRKPQRAKGESYTVASYRRAIERGCIRAERALHAEMEKRGEAVTDAHTIPAWHPNQLRHNAATRLREQFGIEAARVVLGHKSAAVTEVYAERDVKAAEKIMAQVG